jgi:hypothetical protein
MGVIADARRKRLLARPRSKSSAVLRTFSHKFQNFWNVPICILTANQI